MDPDKSTAAPGAAPMAAPPSWRERLRFDKSSVPAAAVVAVAIVSVTTAVMVTRQEGAKVDVRPPPSVADNRVVRAPPLVVKAPPLNSAQQLAQARRARDGGPATDSAGAGPGCRNCGVVESVASNRPSTYQMRVRMDDGTLKSVEQRAAFPAGSRVVLEGGTVRAATENG
jgi:hypothetical protein